MKNKTNFLIGIIGVLVVFLTIANYLFWNPDMGKQAIDQASLIFMIIAESLFFSGIIFISNSKKNNTFMKAGITTLLVIYFMITIILCVLLSSIFSNAVGMFSMINITLITLIVIISLIMVIFDTKNNKEGEQE